MSKKKENGNEDFFIDESGDLGTKKLSSRYFVMAAIKVDDPKKIRSNNH